MMRARLAKDLVLIVLLVLFLTSMILVHAKTPNIAVTGSFYKYEYTLAPNTTISGRDIYIAVMNKADEPINVTLGYEAPSFIKITFSQTNITLKPGGYRIIYINISALSDALPGEYEVKIYANIVMKTVEGRVILVPGAGQRTIVRVVGPVGRIIAETTDREGRHVNTKLRLLRVTSSGEYTYVINKTGYIDTFVPPGEYIVRATLAGETLAEKKVKIQGNETKSIKLLVSTVWFDYFDVLSYYKDNNIVFAEIIGVLKNVYRPINNTSIILVVQYNGAFLENITMATIPVLTTGRTEYKYRYIPMKGWENGTYSFKLVLVSGSKKYAETVSKEINVTIYSSRNVTKTSTENKTITVTVSSKEEIKATETPWILLIVIIAIAAIIATLVYRFNRKT